MGLRGRRVRVLACVLALLVGVPCLLRWRGDGDGASTAAGDANAIGSARDGAFAVRLGRGQQEYVDTRGVHVVVGRYIGDAADSDSMSANLTEEELNANNFSPMEGAGRGGLPVLLPASLQSRARRLYRINSYNLVASDRVPLDRALPDVRKKKCYNKYSAEGLPDASIIIVFHNEAWSTLLRTVHSVIGRSPQHLLKEIILVDDNSTRAFLGAPLEAHVGQLPVATRVLRTSRREGLVRARMLGARNATGRVLVFLDAHCECTKGWLEPLLTRIHEDPTRVVCPVIDIINEDTLAYVRAFDLHWGAFNWALHFRWFTPMGADLRARKNDMSEPFRTPAMAGGLFAMDKKYFFELGAYDEQMEVWGGENLEMSFRVWQCGGTVEIAPCSHVGHIFRKSSPYSFPGGVSEVLYSNLARVALVWMDDWKEFVFKLAPEAARLKDRQSVRARLHLRQRLKCKDFSWYLNTVWPQHFFPDDRRFFGKIHNRRSDRCLQNAGGGISGREAGGAAVAVACQAQNENKMTPAAQLFVATLGANPNGDGGGEGAIMTDESLCLDAPAADSATAARRPKARFARCADTQRQRWKFDSQTNNLVHPASGMCLAEIDELVVLEECSSDSRQQWLMNDVPWK